MPFPDGTSLSDIFDGGLPSSFRDLIDRFTTDGVTSTPFTGGTQHSGTLKSLQSDPIELGFGELNLPGVTAGIPFRLAIFDSPPAGHWHLDIVLNGFSLKLDDLHGADFVKENGTTPRRLVRRAVDTAVVISGEATIRFAKASDDAAVVLLFVENASAADPVAETGAVVSLTCTPPHFFFGTSQYAMTIKDLLFDASSTFSPAWILGQGQDAEWMGFALAEATFYAPPNAIGRGGFSGGVRNLLIGSPRGLQGEFEIQWGRSPLDPSTFVFTQSGQSATAATGSGNTRLVAITAGQDDTVGMQASFIASQPPEGGGDWGATWRWPDGTEIEGDVAAGTVRHGQVLTVTPSEQVDGRTLRHPEIAFRFVAAGEVPAIDVVTSGQTVENVINAAGPKAGLAALTFTARSTAPAPGSFTWKLGETGADKTGASVTYTAAEITADDAWLVLRETMPGHNARVARLRLQVAEGVPLLLGGEHGVVDAAAPATVITPAAVEGTFDLADFHALARFTTVLDDAEIDAARPEKVVIPDGDLARVTIASGGAPPVDEFDRHVQLLFRFDSGTVVRWGPAHPASNPAGGSEGDLQRQLLAWAANYPGASFEVIGRCDDLGSDAYNAGLAQTRAATAVRFLTQAPAGSGLAAIAAASVKSWGEQDNLPPGADITPLNSEEAAKQRLVNAIDDTTLQPLTDKTGWTAKYDANGKGEPERQTFRRVDIYAIGGTPAQAAVVRQLSPGRAPDLRRVLMPGASADPVPADLVTPAMDYRVKLAAGWNKPTGEGWKDLIPSHAEFEFAWSPEDQPLPDLGGDPVTLEVLTVYGSWKHEDASGFTRTQLGIKSDGDPDGLIKIDQDNLVAAMALGPVLLSGIDSTTDTVEKAGRVAALAAGVAFAKVDLGGDGPLLGPASKAVIKSIEATAEIGNLDDVGNDYKISLTSDYSTTLHVNTGALGLKTEADHPVIFRFNDVGIVFDRSKDVFWDMIAVAYPTDALTIEDPGKWKIDGVLGKLLRAVETALGMGSLWIETRFAFALTIGVVEISEAVVRVTFDPAAPPGTLPEFSLRGLVARIDIPATLKGEGRLRIEDGGVIKAGIDIDVIPVGLKASAAFAMASKDGPPPFTFVNLYAKVQFPVGIPLGPSGAALHGFIGQTVINGTRDVAADPDIVTREIGWWRKNPEDKYEPLKDQHALGLGAVVGTLPDASFSLSATGMIVVAFPDPEVIFAVEINLLSVPDKTAKEKKDGQSASITGLVVIDDKAVALAAQARYEIPKILKVQVPFSAYFPYSGNGVYVRLGSDGQPGRPGEPVTLTLLPDTINLQAYSYLMIEQNGLPHLGGKPEFSFQGFSVGFGAGAGLEWKAGPIKLSASILLLAGLGTDPVLIKAGIFVKGSLDLVVVSISATGEIVLTYQDNRLRLDGEFCGEVDCWFFSIKGCVKFHIGDPPQISVPPPPVPVTSVSLADRHYQVMGEAKGGAGALAAQPLFKLVQVGDKVENQGVAPAGNQTVWADTAPVINFRHFIQDAIPAGHQFNPLKQPSGEIWFGSNRLKYTYRLDDVRLVRVSDGVAVSGSAPLQSVWTTSPARQPGSGGDMPPSGAEVQSLKLLDWQPWGWALPMLDGGASAPGDPADTVGNVCTPVPRPARSCLFGRDARSFGPDRIRLLHETPPPGPYPSFFTAIGRVGLRTATSVIDGPAIAALLSAAGALPLPGAVVTLAQPVTGPQGPLAAGYRLPAAQVATPGQVAVTSLPWLAEFDRTIRRGQVLLLVCDGKSRAPATEPAKCYRFEGLSIGKAFAELAVPGFMLAAQNPQAPFTVTDDVNLTQANPVLGTDRHPEIRIAFPGLVIKPTAPVQTLDLHFFRKEALATLVKWTDAAGKAYQFTEPGAALGAVSVRLQADAPIAEITIAIRAKQLYLTELCSVGADAAGTCFTFAGLKPDQVAQGTFTQGDAQFTALDLQAGMRLVDMVDAGATPPKRGQDGVADLRFPDKGVEIKPVQAWADVSIGVISGGREVIALAFDAAGNLLAQARDPAKSPVELHLAASGIARIVVSGGSNEASIWRVCHADDKGGTDGGRCFGFGDKPARGLDTLEMGEVTFTPARQGETIVLIDVLAGTDSVTPGRDGLVELLIPAGGLLLAPKAPVGGMTLYVALTEDGKAEATAYDAAGKPVAGDAAAGKKASLLRLSLAADAIARIELHASGKSLLTRVCTQPTDRTLDGLPIVVTRIDKTATRWTPKVLGTVTGAEGHACRLVTYTQPAEVLDAPGFDMVTPAGHEVTLLSICGVDTKAVLAQAQDATAQAALGDAITQAANADPAEPTRQILLEPGQAYRIEVDWSYQSWTSNEKGTDSPPPTPPADKWIAGTTQSFRFQVAQQQLAIADTQDGLNEFKFDPRDLARYLDRTEPADGRDVVFTADPLWVHFDTGHVVALAEQYGQEFKLEVRRTDPPPQPDAAAMDVAIWPERVEVLIKKAPISVLPLAEQRINAAAEAAPCLPDGPPLAGTSLGAVFKLEPNAMYDFNLVAVKKGAAPAAADPVVVNATRFKTSRYANPAEMLAALGFATASPTPYVPQELVLGDAASLPAGPATLGDAGIAAALKVSDLDLGAALMAIGADTLPLPGDTARTIALWQRTGAAYGIVGFLVDAPEPMRREAAVVKGSQAVDSVRIVPERITLAGAVYVPVRATFNWTRVLFVRAGVAASPLVPPADATAALRFKLGDGTTITGSRIVGTRPLMFDTEGF